MTLTFGLLLLFCSFAFVAVSLACGLVAAEIMRLIRGTDFEPHVTFLTETERLEVEARVLREQRRFNFQPWVGSNALGYHPFNASLWDRFIEANETPEAAHGNIRLLRTLTRVRQSALFVGFLALIGLIVSSYAN